MTRIRNTISYFILHTSYFNVFLLSLAALRPILQRNLPCSDDVAFHLLRLTQLDWLLRNGILYSRWAPDMAQGYGYPIFNFYAPLSYYVAEIFSGFGQNLHLGVRLTFAFGMLASGLTMYRLARDHFSQPAALVAAVAYMYAPYQAYDILFRGNLAESFAWWLLPLALFFIGRLARTGQFKYFLPTTLTYAAILLTHNAFALIFSPVLALYALWVAITTYNLQATTTTHHNPKSKIQNPLSLSPFPSSLRSSSPPSSGYRPLLSAISSTPTACWYRLSSSIGATSSPSANYSPRPATSTLTSSILHHLAPLALSQHSSLYQALSMSL